MHAIVDVLKQNAMHLLSVQVASEQRDLKKATDLVITIEGGDVAVRIRRPGFRGKYRDLTIRSWRHSQATTELEKIRGGFCDWYLYGWSDGKDGLDDWFLVDLKQLRACGLLNDPPFKLNPDGRTGFVYIADAVLRAHGCMVAEKQQNVSGTVQLRLALS